MNLLQWIDNVFSGIPLTVDDPSFFSWKLVHGTYFLFQINVYKYLPYLFIISEGMLPHVSFGPSSYALSILLFGIISVYKILRTLGLYKLTSASPWWFAWPRCLKTVFLYLCRSWLRLNICYCGHGSSQSKNLPGVVPMGPVQHGVFWIIETMERPSNNCFSALRRSIMALSNQGPSRCFDCNSHWRITDRKRLLCKISPIWRSTRGRS